MKSNQPTINFLTIITVLWTRASKYLLLYAISFVIKLKKPTAASVVTHLSNEHDHRCLTFVIS